MNTKIDVENLICHTTDISEIKKAENIIKSRRKGILYREDDIIAFELWDKSHLDLEKMSAGEIVDRFTEEYICCHTTEHEYSEEPNINNIYRRYPKLRTCYTFKKVNNSCFNNQKC